jgi:hypothetical protein
MDVNLSQAIFLLYVIFLSFAAGLFNAFFLRRAFGKKRDNGMELK